MFCRFVFPTAIVSRCLKMCQIINECAKCCPSHFSAIAYVHGCVHMCVHAYVCKCALCCFPFHTVPSQWVVLCIIHFTLLLSYRQCLNLFATFQGIFLRSSTHFFCRRSVVLYSCLVNPCHTDQFVSDSGCSSVILNDVFWLVRSTFRGRHYSTSLKSAAV